MTKLNRIGLISLAALMGISVTAPAMAAPEQYCQDYAGLAVLQSTAMQNQNIGCTGFRWHNWYDGHYSWCRGVPQASALAEIIVRQHAISNNGPC